MMASAMMERAEFPMHRNRTLKCRGVILPLFFRPNRNRSCKSSLSHRRLAIDSVCRPLAEVPLVSDPNISRIVEVWNYVNPIVVELWREIEWGPGHEAVRRW